MSENQLSVQHWLIKSELNDFSIDDFKNEPQQTTCWEGIRNYQARNYMRDKIKQGNRILFYHSSCRSLAVVGLAEVVKEGYPDDTAWDKCSKYYDPQSSPEKPRWFRIDITWKETFKTPVTLKWIKSHSLLQNMRLVQPGQRLSIQPVMPNEFDLICKVGRC